METRRQQEIRLFKLILECPSGSGIECEDGEPDLDLLRKWKKSGIIDANTGKTKGGVAFLGPCLTPYGHSVFEQRLREEEESTSVGLIKKHRFKFYAWFFGLILAPVLVWVIIEAIKRYA